MQAHRKRLGAAPAQADLALTLLAQQHAATLALSHPEVREQLARYRRDIGFFETVLESGDGGVEVESSVLVDPNVTHIGIAVASIEPGRFVVALVVGRAEVEDGRGAA